MTQQSTIYKLLLAPQLRILRYLAVFIFFIIVSLNQALMSYAELFSTLGNKIYLIIITTILIYVGIMTLTIRVFVPKFLFEGKYLAFIIWVVISALLFTLVPNIVYILFFDNHEFFTVLALIDNSSAFVIYLLCIIGVIVPVFLKRWMISNQQLNQLKTKREVSLVRQLKEQINPSLFFKILNRSESLVRTEPTKASTMLMKLSQVLRYQLYDCSKDKVLLTAELSFLKNSLDLEHLYSQKLKYTIKTENDLTNIFIPSSILLPYIQSVINSLDNSEETQTIDISVNNSDKNISVLLSVLGIKDFTLLNNELEKARERFETLYKNKYLLTVSQSNSKKGVVVNLQLDKE